MKGWGFGGTQVFADKVKVTESDGKGLGWVAEKEFGGEAADFDVSAGDGVKEGGVGRGAESARDVSGKGGVFEISDGGNGGIDRESRATWGRCMYVGMVGASVRDIWGLRVCEESSVQYYILIRYNQYRD